MIGGDRIERLSEELEEVRAKLEALSEAEQQRAQAEASLLESDERFRTIYNNTPVMMHSIDDEGKIININDYWLQVMGYERSEVLGRKSIDFLTEESRRYAVEVGIPQMRKQGSVKDVDYEFVKKNGETIDVVLSAVAEFDKQGKIDYTLAMIVDVTARKRAEAALRQSEERFHRIFDASNDAILVIDPSLDRIVDVNPRACDMLGYSRKELLSTPISAIHPNEMAALKEFVETVFRGGHGWTNELTCLTKSGQALASEISASPIALGHEKYVVAMVRDVTDRKEAEAALQESEARFRRLVEHAADAFFVIDPDGRVIDVNQRACENLGYSRDELVGMTVPEFSNRTREGIAAILEQIVPGVPFTTEGFHIRKDGSNFPVEVRIGILHEGERKLRVALARDITERKKAEDALRESEERFAGIFRSAMDAIVIVDAERRITMFNEAAERVFRCPAEKAIGKPFEKFLTQEFRAVLEECLVEFKEKGVEHRYLWTPEGLTAIRADDEQFPVEATISRVEVAGEELCAIILRDVDDRKRAEAELQKLQREKTYLQEELSTIHKFEEMIGTSPAMRAVFADIEKVASTDSTVLITGETGTGKELIARAIHNASSRKDRVLVNVNCAALPAGLIESELFGHEKGAFTGATSRKVGRFELADGGSIFLDEVGDLPVDLQAKLLRVLQEGEFERVGGSETKEVDVRVIAATNRDLETAVREDRFRPDLYYRLNVFPIHVPALRERKEDIPLLVRHFVMKYETKIGKRIETIPQDAMGRLRAYSWPGNVRELENVIERSVIVTQGMELELGNWLPEPGGPAPISRIPTLEELERQHITDVLQLTGRRVRGDTGAAKVLGLKPTTLEARMKKLGIKRRS